MASYTYSLIDSGDGAVAAYFGTASMAEANAAQSLEYDPKYIYDRMSIDTTNLEWNGDDEPDSDQKGIFSVGLLERSADDMGTTYYTFPSAVGEMHTDSADIFGTENWDYYSLLRSMSYNAAGLNYYWFVSGDPDEEGNPDILNSFILKETFQILPDSYNIITSPEMTVVRYYSTGDADAIILYSQPFDMYQNLGISEPTVRAADDDANAISRGRGFRPEGDKSYSYTYMDGELAGIRAKFASPAGSTSLSLMQAMISSSVDKIYNTSNISRFNFKKTRAEALKPREVSSIDLIKDFNRPYRGTTSG